jgi:hypothetical protein
VIRVLTSAAVAAAVLAAGFATTANATQFIGTFDVTANQDGGPTGGLVINTTPDNGPINGASGFSLTQGHSTTFGLFDIFTPEQAVNGDDLAPRPITVSFTFTSPTDFGGVVGGTTNTTFLLFGILDAGSVTWSNPTDFSFGNGGDLRVSLSNEVFNTGFIGSFNEGPGHGAQVRATFKLVKDSVTAVPEPASWALMIGGFGMAGGMLRRRRETATVA